MVDENDNWNEGLDREWSGDIPYTLPKMHKFNYLCVIKTENYG